jgi:hypothetical protein
MKAGTAQPVLSRYVCSVLPDNGSLPAAHVLLAYWFTPIVATEAEWGCLLVKHVHLCPIGEGLLKSYLVLGFHTMLLFHTSL